MKVTRTGIITLVIMTLILIIVGVYLFFSFDQSEVQKRKQTPAAVALIVPEEAPQFTDKNGNSVQLDNTLGSITVVTSWASWCPSCTTDIILLGELANELQRADVKYLAINRAESSYAAQRYLDTFQIPDSISVVLDPADHFFNANTGYAMPETLVYGRDGEVLLHVHGNIQRDELRSVIEKTAR